jgi:hypothetical protein
MLMSHAVGFIAASAPAPMTAARVVGQWQQHRDEVGLAERAVQRADRVDARGLAHGPPAPRHADHAHAEGARDTRDVAPDVAEPHDRQRLAEQAIRQHVVEPAALSLGVPVHAHALSDPRAPANDVLGHPRAEDSGHAGDLDARRQLRAPAPSRRPRPSPGAT